VKTPYFSPEGPTAATTPALLRVRELVAHVEALPAGATGALAFGEEGVILVEHRRICWAIAHAMPERLSDFLCREREPPLQRAQVEAVFRRCKREGTPLGEALVASRLLSEVELRAALEHHTCEAILRLALGQVRAPTSFTRHSGRGYNPSFVFAAPELLASLSSRGCRPLSSHAATQLARTLVPESSGVAFLRDRSGEPSMISVGRGMELSLSDTLQVVSWAAGALDIASFVDPSTMVVSGTWCSRLGLVAWRERELHFVALCTSRPASTRLLTGLRERLATRRSGTLLRRKDAP
jgi:hypothetical protein